MPLITAVNGYQPEINSSRDFGQLWILIANICETNEANDKRKTALSIKMTA